MQRSTTGPARALAALAALAAAASLLAARPLGAQWTMLATGTGAEFRGLDAPSDSIAWAVGKFGTVARTTDAGRTWRVATIPGADSLFLVDVHATGADTAVVAATDFAGGLGRIYRTVDGGRTWTERFAHAAPGMFLDGLAFWDAARGVAFGDPIDGVMYVVRTEDGGATWERVPPAAMPPIVGAEAGFAASGTAVATAGTRHAWIGTGGGPWARVLRTDDAGRTWTAVETPLPASSSAGIFGLAFRDTLHGVAVGGDYRLADSATVNVLRTTDGGRTWILAAASRPAGVRYGVVHLPHDELIVAVGPSGSGWSPDDGRTWVPIGTVGFNTVAVSRGPVATLWAAGVGGRVARMDPRTLPGPRE